MSSLYPIPETSVLAIASHVGIPHIKNLKAALTDHSLQGRLWVSRPIARQSEVSIRLRLRVRYVGNTMATFVMQSLGCDVAALNTVHFSTEPKLLDSWMGYEYNVYHSSQATTPATSNLKAEEVPEMKLKNSMMA